MKVARFQSVGGASGDMALGALVDAGLSLDFLREELRRLPLPEHTLGVQSVQRGHLTATLLEVDIPGERLGLSPSELLDTLHGSSLSDRVKERSLSALNALLEAERRVHRTEGGQVHLHELGSVDTLIDIVGTVAGLEHLGVEKVFASPLVVGDRQPDRPRAYLTPAPATLELAAMSGAPLETRHGVSHEMTTPTGAALLTTLASFQPLPQLTLHRVGYGAGRADLPGVPNVVSVWLGQTTESSGEAVVLLETNLDDAQGVVLGYAQERLFQQGALDVWFTPVQMKKNRPGVVLSALVPAWLQQAAVETILRETPTLGVRTRPVQRQVAHRETVSFPSRYGNLRVKLKYLDEKPVSVAPEYEDCRELALSLGLPLQELYQQVLAEARSQLVDAPAQQEGQGRASLL